MKRRSPPHRVMASLLAALVTVMGVLVPVLDATGGQNGAVIESEHNPTTCLHGHDHTVCSQFGANQGLPSAAPHHRLSQRVPPYVRVTRAVASIASVVAISHPARAPPTA